MPGKDSVFKIIGVGLRIGTRCLGHQNLCGKRSRWYLDSASGVGSWGSKARQLLLVSGGCRNKRCGTQEIFLFFLLGQLRLKYPAFFPWGSGILSLILTSHPFPARSSFLVSMTSALEKELWLKANWLLGIYGFCLVPISSPIFWIFFWEGFSPTLGPYSSWEVRAGPRPDQSACSIPSAVKRAKGACSPVLLRQRSSLSLEFWSCYGPPSCPWS